MPARACNCWSTCCSRFPPRLRRFFFPVCNVLTISRGVHIRTKHNSFLSLEILLGFWYCAIEVRSILSFNAWRVILWSLLEWLLRLSCDWRWVFVAFIGWSSSLFNVISEPVCGSWVVVPPRRQVLLSWPCSGLDCASAYLLCSFLRAIDNPLHCLHNSVLEFLLFGYCVYFLELCYVHLYESGPHVSILDGT